MAENTKVEWATHTFNPWIGCSHVHAGCDNCYAEAQSGRHGVTWGPKGTRHRTSEAYSHKPIAWNKRAAQSGERPRVFSSLCDPFEDWQGIVTDYHDSQLYHYRCSQGEIVRPWDWLPLEMRGMPLTLDDVRRDFFQLINQTQNLDWLLATKRPANVRRMIAAWLRDRCGVESPASSMLPVPNLWLGVSVSNQETADVLIPLLMRLRDLARFVFVSVEPLLGAIDLREWIFPVCDGIDERCESGRCDHSRPLVDWVIVGGESGPKARPCNVEWIRSIVEQCKATDVACFVKQLGASPCSGYGTSPDDICWLPKFSHPKGGDPAEWSKDLRVRELPEA